MPVPEIMTFDFAKISGYEGRMCAHFTKLVKTSHNSFMFSNCGFEDNS